MSFNSKKVLLIDDNIEDLEFIKRLFKLSIFHSQYEIETELDSQITMQKLNSNKYDLCLIDYKWSNQTGIELISKCKKNGCHTVFIMLTALNDESNVNEALYAGVDDYLIKDQINTSTLDRSIRYALQRRQIDKLVNEQQLKLGHAMKMSALGELSASIIHEINNPLAIIKGNVMMGIDLLEQEKANIGEAIQKFQSIDLSIERISKIIRSLKSFSFNEENLKPKLISIRNIIEKTVNICQVRLKREEVSLEYIVPDNLPEIECQENEIIQVLLNLFNNSCDALKNKEARWIKVEVLKKEKCLVLSFTDSGNGIPLEDREKILQPYFTTKAKGTGTGLGLSICKKIIENHGGQFSVDYECKNTKFILELPFFYQEKFNESEPFTIILVEDDIEIREMIQERLSFEQIEILTASSGLEALEILANKKIDLILTDVNMPELSGIQMIKELEAKKNHHTPSVVYITGQPLESLQFPEQSALGLTIFSKPIDFNNLKSHIKKLMQ